MQWEEVLLGIVLLILGCFVAAIIVGHLERWREEKRRREEDERFNKKTSESSAVFLGKDGEIQGQENKGD